MDVAVAGDSQQFEELALAAAKEKAGFVRKRIGDEKADVSCRCPRSTAADLGRRAFLGSRMTFRRSATSWMRRRSGWEAYWTTTTATVPKKQISISYFFYF